MAPDTFRFLNQSQRLVQKKDWDNPLHDKLWRYNLHYFDDLNATGAACRMKWHSALLLRWVAENTPVQGTGWESYPTSLRIVNWIKWALKGNVLPAECLSSLAVQTRWLMKRLEFHLLGNHLFSNAKALIFSGLFFQGSEADRWLDKGLTILATEIPEQILGDGGQFERSPMYHSLALEDMLDLCNITSAYTEALAQQGRDIIAGWPETASRMQQWLIAMSHPDGEISFFNDAALGIAPSPLELEHYAERLGISARGPAVETVTPLVSSGYIRVGKPGFVALLDIAPIGPDYLPAHAHADTLSFELSLDGYRVFVNSGTSLYEAGEDRSWQRGTSAHNTVVLNGMDSSEVWAGFRVGRRARPSRPEIREEGRRVVIAAHHDGYRWLPGRNYHYRTWHFDIDSIVIEDRITGDFEQGVAYFHLHPEVRVDECRESGFAVVRHPRGSRIELAVEGGRIRVQASKWHPAFGVSEPNVCLAVVFQTAAVKTTIRWSSRA